MAAEEALEIGEDRGRITFAIVVAPRSSREGIGPVLDGRVKVAVNAAPVAGAANKAVVGLLARALGVRKADVEIVAGGRGKRKLVRVQGVAAAALRRALERGR